MRIFTRFILFFSIFVLFSSFGCSTKTKVKGDKSIDDAKTGEDTQTKKNSGWAKTDTSGVTSSVTLNNSGAKSNNNAKNGAMEENLQGEKLARAIGSTDNSGGKSDEELKKETEALENRFEELQKIYFDYDSSDIRDEARETLQSDADLIKNKLTNDILIEGHCDERGTDEYNLALGQRRAESVKTYLVALGVPEMRMTTISYGEAKPDVQGNDEAAWKFNRRAILKEIKE